MPAQCYRPPRWTTRAAAAAQGRTQSTAAARQPWYACNPQNARLGCQSVRRVVKPALIQDAVGPAITDALAQGAGIDRVRSPPFQTLGCQSGPT